MLTQNIVNSRLNIYFKPKLLGVGYSPYSTRYM